MESVRTIKISLSQSVLLRKCIHFLEEVLGVVGVVIELEALDLLYVSMRVLFLK